VSRSLQPPSSRVPTVIARTQKAAVNLDPAKMTITVEPWDPVNNTADWVEAGDVTVRASYPFKIRLLGLVVFDGTIKSRTTERVE
jgi:hypothetical protein